VNASYEVSDLECVCCSCETDAVRRPAARLSFDTHFQAVACHFARRER